MMLRICYKSTISEGEVITGGSAFSVKAESLRLGDFTRGDVGTLLGQHTAETGQAFAPGGVEMVWTQTRGQPWLVNALARQLCFRRERPVVRDRPISERDAFEAREAPGHAHRAACRQAARTEGAGRRRAAAERRRRRALRSGRRLCAGRGRIEREYALGSRGVELLVVWPEGDGRESRFVVECKLVGEGRSHARTVEKGLVQTAAYMDLSGTEAGHLVVFDMRSGRTWGEKVFREESAVGGGDCGVGGIGAGGRAHRCCGLLGPDIAEVWCHLGA